MGSARLARRWFAVLGLAASPSAGAAGFGATLGASSDNVFRGISESAGDPSVQAGVHYAWDGGAFGGLRAASIKQRTLYRTRDTLELDAFVGFGSSWGEDWDGRVMLIHYAYPWSEPRRSGYDELSLSATWRGRLTVAAAASPNTAGGGNPAYDYEVGLRWPVADAWSLDAGAGYYDLRRVYDVAYAYWSAGVSYGWREATFTLSWIGADQDARNGYGELADNRVVTSVLWTF